jgi:hypothetical protein
MCRRNKSVSPDSSLLAKEQATRLCSRSMNSNRTVV